MSGNSTNEERPVCVKCGDAITPGYRYHAHCLGSKGVAVPNSADGRGKGTPASDNKEERD